MRRRHGLFNIEYKQELVVIRTRFEWTIFLAFLALMVVIPWLVGLGLIDFLVRVGITLIVVMGLNLITGYCGQISLGHAAFMGLGGFTGAILLKGNMPFVLVILIAGFAAGIAGLIFGMPALRVKGLYLAFTTLSAHYIIMFALVRFMGGTVGHQVDPPVIFGFAFDSDIRIYYLVLGMVILSTFVAKNIIRAKAGRAFVAIRDHDIAANTLGINVYYYRLLAFFIGCFFAGVGGILQVVYFNWASVDTFTLWNAIWYLGMLIIGGSGTIVGVFFGTFFIVGLEEFSTVLAPILGESYPAIAGTVLGALPIFVFSFVLMLFIVFEPRGLAHRWEIVKESFRLFPFNY
jgi:branched-chain amino acid transport system permease protein